MAKDLKVKDLMDEIPNGRKTLLTHDLMDERPKLKITKRKRPYGHTFYCNKYPSWAKDIVIDLLRQKT